MIFDSKSFKKSKKMTHKSKQTNGGGARAVRGRSAGDPRAIRGQSAAAWGHAAFWAVLPASAPRKKNHHDDGDREQGAAQKPENEHRAQAPRAAPNQGFEGSKCY